jgi:hypothetical protein
MCGSVTHNTPAAVIAASTALPPARSTSTAASDAAGEDVAVMPPSPWTVDLPGN